jgi:hypothetical protein
LYSSSRGSRETFISERCGHIYHRKNISLLLDLLILWYYFLGLQIVRRMINVKLFITPVPIKFLVYNIFLIDIEMINLYNSYLLFYIVGGTELFLLEHTNINQNIFFIIMNATNIVVNAQIKIGTPAFIRSHLSR